MLPSTAGDCGWRAMEHETGALRFFDLPAEYLAQQILTEWLTLKDLAILDSSVCMRVNRSYWMHLLNYGRVFMRWKVTGVRYCHDAVLRWLHPRASHLDCLEIPIAASREALELLLMQRGAGLIAILLNQYTPELLEVICTNCPFLQDLRIGGGVRTPYTYSGKELYGKELAGPKISDGAVARVAESFPLLRVFHIKGPNSVGDDAIRSLCGNCRLLEDIDLSSCCRISDAALHMMAQQQLPLRRLNVDATLSLSAYRSVTDNGLRPLLPPTSSTCGGYALDNEASGPKLQSLRVSNRRDVTDSTLLRLAAAHPLQLQELTLSGCSAISEYAVCNLSLVASNLRVLELAHVRAIGDDTIAIVAQRCPLLETVNLRRCTFITSTGLRSIAEHCSQLHCLIADCTRHMTTDEAMCIVSNGCKQLRRLELHNASPVSVRHALNSSVTAAAHAITVPGVINRYASIETATETVLHSDRNDRSTVSTGIQCLVRQCSRLQHLLLDGVVRDPDVQHLLLHYEQQLKVLDVPNSSALNGSGISRGIKSGNCRLLHLNLRKTGIDSSVLVAIAQGCRTLRSLDIAYCRQLNDVGMMQIGENCSELVVLNVSHCTQLTDASMTVVARGCRKLYSLDMSSCSIRNSTLEVLARNCLRLQELKLENCALINEVGVNAVMRNCPLLTTLLVSGSPIDSAAIATGASLRRNSCRVW